MTKEMRLYVREGQHSRETGMNLDTHVVLFARGGFRLEGLDHLTYVYHRRLPITVVRTDCPDAHSTLEGNGYTRMDRNYRTLDRVPAHENDF